jgi:hypothetical protein
VIGRYGHKILVTKGGSPRTYLCPSHGHRDREGLWNRWRLSLWNPTCPKSLEPNTHNDRNHWKDDRDLPPSEHVEVPRPRSCLALQGSWVPFFQPAEQTIEALEPSAALHQPACARPTSFEGQLLPWPSQYLRMQSTISMSIVGLPAKSNQTWSGLPDRMLQALAPQSAQNV